MNTLRKIWNWLNRYAKVIAIVQALLAPFVWMSGYDQGQRDAVQDIMILRLDDMLDATQTAVVSLKDYAVSNQAVMEMVIHNMKVDERERNERENNKINQM